MNFQDKSNAKNLNIQEDFFKTFIQGERFFKKYKFYILGIIICLLIWLAASIINEKIKEKNTEENNQIYLNLIQNPNNTEISSALKEKNINLYAIFLLNQLNNKNDLKIIEQLKQISQDSKINLLIKNIIDLELHQKSLFLKDYSKILQAYNFLEQNKIEEARVLLTQIKSNSELKQIADNLKHYQGIN
ncbi:hypothetical protein JG676_04145 [Campylobacter sp. 2018MI35]|uniref:hypothetical protein n=1 Tax=unclassified Campylobacter TaxID=2593542 RepID=UPI00190410AB|nr:MULTISPECIES: hypothetical protein [unclassified Campylobacter]MBK1972096.1 hypothetical protein [Campylobacter sp. TTU_617]MBK1991789.1 hypothetical protein [Campylobacter sp. 2018MI34]